MIEENVDLVAGDFTNTNCRRKVGVEQKNGSTLEETFSDARLPMPPGPTPLWDPGGIPHERTDVSASLSLPTRKMNKSSASTGPSRATAKSLVYQTKTRRASARHGSICVASVRHCARSRRGVTCAAGAARTEHSVARQLGILFFFFSDEMAFLQFELCRHLCGTRHALRAISQSACYSFFVPIPHPTQKR